MDGHLEYGNNGEDFIAFEMKTETWIPLDAQAESIKLEWDEDKSRKRFWKNFLTKDCYDVLHKSVSYGRSYLNRKGKDL